MERIARAHAADLRKGRWSVIDQIYHITSCTLERKPIFENLYAARTLIRTLRAESNYSNSITLAFVVMPDHFHWLMQLGDADLSKIVGRVKSLVARRVGKTIWQSGYYDHAVRKEEDLRVIARYIITNPVRAGLVDNIDQYPHWDAIWM